MDTESTVGAGAFVNAMCCFRHMAVEGPPHSCRLTERGSAADAFKHHRSHVPAMNLRRRSAILLATFILVSFFATWPRTSSAAFASVGRATTTAMNEPMATVEPLGCCSGLIAMPVPATVPAEPAPAASPGTSPLPSGDAMPSTLTQRHYAQPAKALPARSLPYTGRAVAILAILAGGVILIGGALLGLSRAHHPVQRSGPVREGSRFGSVHLVAIWSRIRRLWRP
jgi:hypothetical protein